MKHIFYQPISQSHRHQLTAFYNSSLWAPSPYSAYNCPAYFKLYNNTTTVSCNAVEILLEMALRKCVQSQLASLVVHEHEQIILVL